MLRFVAPKFDCIVPIAERPVHMVSPLQFLTENVVEEPF